MRILFMSDLLMHYEVPLKSALSELDLPSFEISDKKNEKIFEVNFIIYSPVKAEGKLIERDFSIYKNNKAVLSLYAGVEHLINNPSLSCPLIKMVDEGLTNSMVEWCVAHTLRIHLGIDRHILGQDGIWRHHIKPPIAKERKVGVLGLGALGEPTAKALKNLGFNVSGWSKTKKDLEGISCLYGKNGLMKILKFSEILILLLPLTKETFHIIDDETLSLMPKNAAILNAGRGGLIDDEALLKKLKSGHLSNATLDVFSVEPLPPSHPYWLNPRVTVTPHIAGDTPVESSSRSIAMNINMIMSGERPLGLVDIKKGY